MAISTINGASAGSSGNLVTTATNGLVRITSGTLSGASAITVDGCFTSTYKNYILYLNTNYSGSADQDAYLQLRANGVTNSSSNYAFNVNYINAGLNAGTAASNTGSSGAIIIYDNMDDGSVFNGSIQFFNPQINGETQFEWGLYGADNGYRKQMLGFASLNVIGSFDGFYLSMQSGTLTGTYDVYGVAR